MEIQGEVGRRRPERGWREKKERGKYLNIYITLKPTKMLFWSTFYYKKNLVMPFTYEDSGFI